MRDRDFAVGRVEHVLRDREATCATAQLAEQFDPVFNTYAKMRSAFKQLRLIAIVRSNSHRDQGFVELLHRGGVIVNPFEQHSLVADGDAGVDQLLASRDRSGGDLFGMIEVRVDPDGVMALEHLAQRVGDAVRKRHGEPGSQAYDLDVRDLTQTTDQPVEAVVCIDEGVAAGEKDIADFRGAGDPVECLAEFAFLHGPFGLAHHALAQTEAAVERALVVDAERNAVGIDPNDVLDGRVGDFVQRICEPRSIP